MNARTRRRPRPRATTARRHDHDHGSEDGRPRIAFIGAGQGRQPRWPSRSRAPAGRSRAVASRDEESSDALPAARARRARVRGAAGRPRRSGPDLHHRARRRHRRRRPALHLYSGQALVHTSGALPASVLAPAMAAGTNIGGFHPLVAFADHDQALADLRGRDDRARGRRVAPGRCSPSSPSRSAPTGALPEGGKTAYHAAAMMAAGGLVGLLDAIASVAAVAGLDEKTAMAVYAPLARQALANAERMGIAPALTGPLLRGDVGTLQGPPRGSRGSMPPERCRSMSRSLDARLPSPSRGASSPTGAGARDRGTARPGRAESEPDVEVRTVRVAIAAAGPNSLPFGPMRSSHAAIRGDRPTTRFATQTVQRRAPHLGHTPHDSGAPRPVTDSTTSRPGRWSPSAAPPAGTVRDPATTGAAQRPLAHPSRPTPSSGRSPLTAFRTGRARAARLRGAAEQAAADRRQSPVTHRPSHVVWRGRHSRNGLRTRDLPWPAPPRAGRLELDASQGNAE